MNIRERIYRLKNYNVVQHAKYNPEGQGILRIQLLPSKNAFRTKSDIVILNNSHILPIAPAWSILLSNFMRNLNEDDGNTITDEELEKYIDKTVQDVSKIFVTMPKAMLKDDMYNIIEVFTAIAKGEKVHKNIGQQTLAEYSKYMMGPHKVFFMLNNVDSKANKHCNNRCLHYSEPFKQTNSVKELSTEDWKQIIKKCQKACIPHIVFTGGKPTEREDLIELIEESKWFMTTLHCTGKKLTEDFCDKLYNASLDNVVITLYSKDKEIHNKLAGEDNFDSVVSGIKNALKFNLYVTVHISLCKMNSNILQTIKYLEKLGVKNFSISIMDQNTDNRDNFGDDELTKDEVYKLLEKTAKYIDEKSLQLNFESNNFLDRYVLEKLNIDPPICGACVYEIAIKPDGTVMPCINVCDEKLALGNMLVNSWKEIWNSSKTKRIKKIALIDVTKCPIKKYIQK